MKSTLVKKEKSFLGCFKPFIIKYRSWIVDKQIPEGVMDETLRNLKPQAFQKVCF